MHYRLPLGGNARSNQRQDIPRFKIEEGVNLDAQLHYRTLLLLDGEASVKVLLGQHRLGKGRGQLNLCGQLRIGAHLKVLRITNRRHLPGIPITHPPNRVHSELVIGKDGVGKAEQEGIQFLTVNGLTGGGLTARNLLVVHYINGQQLKGHLDIGNDLLV